MTMQKSPVLSLTILATGTITQHRFVTPAGAEAGAGVNTLGVATTAAASGSVFPVDVLGTTIVESGAAVTANATLKTDATGRAIDWVTSGGKVAIALEAATAAGQLIEVLLIPNAV